MERQFVRDLPGIERIPAYLNEFKPSWLAPGWKYTRAEMTTEGLRLHCESETGEPFSELVSGEAGCRIHSWMLAHERTNT